jgi:hypothetical protein
VTASTWDLPLASRVSLFHNQLDMVGRDWLLPLIQWLPLRWATYILRDWALRPTRNTHKNEINHLSVLGLLTWGVHPTVVLLSVVILMAAAMEMTAAAAATVGAAALLLQLHIAAVAGAVAYPTTACHI